MYRQNKLAVVCHCALNQNSVVHYLARAKGTFHNIITLLSSYDFGIYQLPCPELIFAGLTRQPQTYEQYATPAYAKVCQDITARVLLDMDQYKKAGVNVDLFLGIRRSPSCSFSDPTGHLSELLLPQLAVRFPDMCTLEIPEDYLEHQPQPFLDVLIKTLETMK